MIHSIKKSNRNISKFTYKIIIFNKYLPWARIKIPTSVGINTGGNAGWVDVSQINVV